MMMLLRFQSRVHYLTATRLFSRYIQTIPTSPSFSTKINRSIYSSSKTDPSFLIVGLAASLSTLTLTHASTDSSSPLTPTHEPSNDSTAQWRIFTDIARDLARSKKYDDAEKYLQRALSAATQGFGPRDPHVASACQNLAELYRLQRKYDLAEPLYDKAIEILFESYGSKDIRVAYTLHNIAGFYFAQRKFEKAAQYYEQSLQVKLACVGPGHTETSNSMFHLAEVRWAQGRRHDALHLAKQSLDALEQQGTSDIACARRRTRLAEMYMEEKKAALAEPLLRTVLEMTSSLNESVGNRAAALENLSKSLQEQQKYEEAVALLIDALDLRRKAWRAHTHAQGELSVASTLRKLADAELALSTLTTSNSNDRNGIDKSSSSGSNSSSSRSSTSDDKMVVLAMQHAKEAVEIAEKMYQLTARSLLQQQQQQQQQQQSTVLDNGDVQGALVNSSMLPATNNNNNNDDDDNTEDTPIKEDIKSGGGKHVNRGWISYFLGKMDKKQNPSSLPSPAKTKNPDGSTLTSIHSILKPETVLLEYASGLRTLATISFVLNKECIDFGEEMLLKSYNVLQEDWSKVLTAPPATHSLNIRSLAAKERLDELHNRSICQTMQALYEVMRLKTSTGKCDIKEYKKKIDGIKKAMKEYAC